MQKYILLNRGELDRQCEILARRVSSPSASTKTRVKSARRLRRNIIKYSKPFDPVMA